MTNIFLIPKDGTRSSRAIPIAIKLCPMKVLANPTWGVANKEIYVDIDKKLKNRLCKIFAELSRVIVRRNKIESSKPNSAISRALGDFQNVIFHYHQFLQIIRVERSSLSVLLEATKKILLALQTRLRIIRCSALINWNSGSILNWRNWKCSVLQNWDGNQNDLWPFSIRRTTAGLLKEIFSCHPLCSTAWWFHPRRSQSNGKVRIWSV